MPQGMAAKGSFDHLAVVVEVDRKYGVIVDAKVTLVTDLAINFVRNCLVGYCLADGIEPIIAEIIDSYHGAAKNAIISAIKDLNREYNKLKVM